VSEPTLCSTLAREFNVPTLCVVLSHPKHEVSSDTLLWISVLMCCLYNYVDDDDDDYATTTANNNNNNNNNNVGELCSQN
jgi:hypothetical protein